MLDGVNAFLQCAKLLWQAFLDAPLYGDLTWGYFLIAVTIVSILLTFFIAKFK